MNWIISTVPRLWALLWLILVATALLNRPLMPVDETRYLSVAWEMWLRGDFLVPYLNGETYSHKPPLLFWLMHAGWAVFGVNEWWPRLVAPLFGLGCLFLTAHLGRRLWPESAAWVVAPLFLLGSFYWATFTTVTMFDMLLCFWALTGIAGLVEAWRGARVIGWVLFAAAVGLGVLSKGPVILVYLLPAALLAPLWAISETRESWPVWYAKVLGGVAVGAALALTWALPAGDAGGEDYRNAILWGQSAGRMVEAFDHQEPWWWYAPILPALALPWLVWPTLVRRTWTAVRGRRSTTGGSANPGLRLAALWVAAAVLVFSTISGKQPHYLIPAMPALALAAAFAVERARYVTARLDMAPAALLAVLLGGTIAFAPEIGALAGETELAGAINRLWSVPLLAMAAWMLVNPPAEELPRIVTIAALGVLAAVSVLVTARPVMLAAYDMRPVARLVASAQANGHAIAYYGKYHGMYNFLGRLTEPIQEIGDADVVQWLRDHPKAKVVSVHRAIHPDGIPDYVQRFRGRLIAVWDRAQVLANPDVAKRGVP